MTSFTRRRATAFTAAIAIVAALLSPLLLAESASAAFPAPFVGVSAYQQAWADKQLGAMTVGVPYSDTIARAPGADSWGIVGDLPAGLNAAIVGDDYVISGTPTTAGDVNFEIWSRLGQESDKLTFNVTVTGSPATSLSLIVAAPAAVSPGQTSNWQVRVKNTHDAYAQNPVVSFTPPPGFVVTSHFEYPDWVCNFAATIVCTNSVGLGFGDDDYAFTFITTAPSSFATSTVTSSAQVSGFNAPARTSSYTTAVNLPETTIAQPIASSYRSTTLTGYAPNLSTDGSIRFFTSSGVELGSASVQANGSATFSGAIPASLSGTDVAFYAEYFDDLGNLDSTSATSQPVYIYQQLNVGGSFYLNGALYTGAVSFHIYADNDYPGLFVQRDLTGGSYAITPYGGLPYEYYMFASIPGIGTTHYNDAGAYLPTYDGHTTVGPQNFTDTMNLYWESAPTFTDATVAVPRQDVQFTDGVTATNNVDVEYSINSGDLPDGLTLDTETGAITGIATTEGELYSFSIRATNTVNAQFANTAAISGTVLAEHIVPTWVDNSLGDFRLNVTVADGVAAAGDPTITYEVSDGDLPSGVTLDETTGQLSGAATVLGEDYEFEIRASNDWGDIDETFSGEVLVALTAPVWTDVALGELRVGETLTDGVSASGEPAPTYTSLDKPAWVTLNSTTGAISATPTTAGPYSFTITAASSEGTVSQLFTGTVEAAWIAPTFTDTTIVQPRVGVYLDDQVLATGDSPITYSVPLGELPAWLTLNPANGLLSGTPPVSALNVAYSFTVTASAHGLSDTVTISGFVAAAPEVVLDPSFVVGDIAAGAEFDYSVSGAGDDVDYTVTVNSTPVVVASGTTSALGGASGSAAVPLGIAPGAHSIVLLTSASDGTPRTVTLWFTVLANGTVGAISFTGPFAVTAAALAGTGVDVGAPLGVAVLLVMLGTVFFVRRRVSLR